MWRYVNSSSSPVTWQDSKQAMYGESRIRQQLVARLLSRAALPGVQLQHQSCIKAEAGALVSVERAAERTYSK
jgi:hypothetical protein